MEKTNERRRVFEGNDPATFKLAQEEAEKNRAEAAALLSKPGEFILLHFGDESTKTAQAMVSITLGNIPQAVEMLGDVHKSVLKTGMSEMLKSLIEKGEIGL